LLLLLCSSCFAQKVVAVRIGKFWDGERVIDRPLVLIEGGPIKSVEAGDPKPPSGADVIDWSRYYGLPGLIDVHTHMTYYWDKKQGPTPRGGRRSPAETVFMAQDNAKKTLEAGVTAVRDLGASDYTDIAMRNLINSGYMTGPRMFVSGYGLNVARPAAGADVIKMYGSVGGFENVGTQQTFTLEEMQAAVKVSHRMGKKIAIHSYGAEGGSTHSRRVCSSRWGPTRYIRCSGKIRASWGGSSSWG
jgi:imidazolonepropionase-like amidohydrolase